jgi:hypothetical protein
MSKTGDPSDEPQENGEPVVSERRPRAVFAALLVMVIYWATEVIAIGRAFRDAACGPNDEYECEGWEDVVRFFIGDTMLFTLPILVLALLIMKREMNAWHVAVAYFSLGLLICVVRLLWQRQSMDLFVFVISIVYPVLALAPSNPLVIAGTAFNVICLALLILPSVRRWLKRSEPQPVGTE